MTPHQIIPALMDKEGRYICSVSTAYRKLRERKQLKLRGKRISRYAKPKTWMANGKNQVWVWDITYLPTTVKGMFYYFYLFQDIWDRYPVGGDVYEEQTAELAEDLFRRIALNQGITEENQLVLHSDNGKPMVAQTMKELLQSFGVTSSHSRPSVSNDNAYAESIFSTAKSLPSYPEQFESLEEARKWALDFIEWAKDHYHSGLNYLTPRMRREEKEDEIIANRIEILTKAKEEHPERWNGRNIRDMTVPKEVYLNPDKEQKKKIKLRKIARDKSRSTNK